MFPMSERAVRVQINNPYVWWEAESEEGFCVYGEGPDCAWCKLAGIEIARAFPQHQIEDGKYCRDYPGVQDELTFSGDADRQYRYLKFPGGFLWNDSILIVRPVR
jgi:hypothetical protein